MTPKRSARSKDAWKLSAAALERALRTNVQRTYALRLELAELEQAYDRLSPAIGDARAWTIVHEERWRWQRATGRCAACRTPLDDDHCRAEEPR